MSKHNTSEYALLGLLTMGPASGYDLRRKTEQQIGHFWNESYASIYPMLKRLLGRGWVERRQVEQSDKPDKRVYSVTDDGRDAFRQWLSEEISPIPPRNILLMKVYFGVESSNAELVRHIEWYRSELTKTLGENESRIAQIKQASDGSSSVYQLLTLSHSIHETRAMLAWCKSAIELLSQRQE